MEFDVAMTDELLATTRAVRKRLDFERPVSRGELIEECIALSQQAPTGTNSQSWRWIIVDDPDKRAALAEIYRKGPVPTSHTRQSSRRLSGDAQTGRVLDSAQFLAENLEHVPVHVIPCLEGRPPEGTPMWGVAAMMGSIFPAVWSFQLALRSRGLGSCLTSCTSPTRRRQRNCSVFPTMSCRPRSCRSPIPRNRFQARQPAAAHDHHALEYLGRRVVTVRNRTRRNMKIAKIVGILVLVYVGIVVVFESLLGYFQPESDNTIVITTTNDDGESFNRVVSLLESQEKMYVAVNHWPRMWYYRLLDNPEILVKNGGEMGNYLAVPVEGTEHDQVQNDNPTGLVFRFLTGFPPRYFIRLDPTGPDASRPRLL